MPGIDINSFVDLNDALSTHLICGICTNIFNKPVETHCRHTFCEDCIEEWLKTNDIMECPICRADLSTEKSHFNTNRLINDIVNDLKVKCKLKDCNKIVSFGSLAKHMTECQFRVCDNCQLLVGNTIDGHNCLELTKNELDKTKIKINDLELENVCLKTKYILNLEQNSLEIEKFKKKIKELQNKFALAKVCNWCHVESEQTCYVTKDVDPNTSLCFEIINTSAFKRIDIDKTFIRIILINELSAGSDCKIHFSMKRDSPFNHLSEALKTKLGLKNRPVLKTIGGKYITRSSTPSELNMANNVIIQYNTKISISTKEHVQ